MTVSKPNTFASNTLAQSAQVNSNFDTIYTAFNSIILYGTGTPEASVTASIGTLYEDQDPAGTGKVYVKISGSANTGWQTVIDTSNSGGGSTPTILTGNDMYSEFYIATTGNKIINVANFVGTNLIRNIWSNSGNLLNARYSGGSAGSLNSGLFFGGYPSSSNITEKFNSSAWTASGNLNTGRGYLAGCGTQNAGLSMGGYTNYTTTEKFNGSTWATTGNLNTGRYGLGGSGTQNSGLSWGGYNNSSYFTAAEKFNGTTWANTGTLNSNKHQAYGCGTQDSTICGGSSVGTNSVVEKFNGAVWIVITSLNTGRYAMGTSGVSMAGLCFGGDTGSVSSVTEKFNGSTWTTTGNLNTARRELGGCGTQNAGLSIGGYISAVSAVTEKFTGEPLLSYYLVSSNDTKKVEEQFKESKSLILNTPCYMAVEVRPLSNGLTEIDQNDLATLGLLDDVVGGIWAASGNINTARLGLAGCGFQNSGLNFGGYTTVAVNNTDKYNGISWTASGVLGTARFYLGGAGTQTAGLSFGGVGGSAITEKFNGTSWSGGFTGLIDRSHLAGCGIQSSALSMGGTINGTDSVANTDRFNGTVWTATGILGTARTGLRSCGTQISSLAFGGYTSGSSSYTAITEKFNGTSWGYTGILNTARGYLGSAGTQNSALSFGGNTGIITEKFNGTSWAISGSLINARSHHGSAGIQNAGLSFGGTTDGTNPISSTERFGTQVTLPYNIPNNQNILVNFNGDATDTYGNPVTVIGTPTYTSNKFNSSGTTGVKYAFPTLGTGSWTIEGRYTFSNVATQQYLLNSNVAGGGAFPLGLSIASGKLTLDASSNGTGYDISTGVGYATMTTGTAYHICVMFDGSKYRVFINGNLDIITTSSSIVYQTLSFLFFGILYNSSGSPLIGTMDDVRVSLGQVRYAVGDVLGTNYFTPPVSGTLTKDIGQKSMEIMYE